jgi:hypothetical protein
VEDQKVYYCYDFSYTFYNSDMVKIKSKT